MKSRYGKLVIELLNLFIVLTLAVSYSARADETARIKQSLYARLSLLFIKPGAADEFEAQVKEECQACQERDSVISKFAGMDTIMILAGRENLSDFAISLKSLRGKRVLSLGDGAPGNMLTPYLRDEGVEAYAVDLDSAYVKRDNPVFKRYGQYLVHADVTKISKLKISGQPFDQVVSSHLLCSLPVQIVSDTLLESLKVLRPGGTSRHIFAPSEIHDKAEFERQVQSVVQRAAQLGMKVSLTQLAGGHMEWDKLPKRVNQDAVHTILIFTKE